MHSLLVTKHFCAVVVCKYTKTHTYLTILALTKPTDAQIHHSSFWKCVNKTNLKANLIFAPPLTYFTMLDKASVL